MNQDGEINIFKALDYIRDHSKEYAEAKANRVYLEEYRKSKKALLMREAELAGHKTAATQEREAYAHKDYIELLEGLKSAIEQEESLRWLIVAAQAKVSVWQTIEATRRIEIKAV